MTGINRALIVAIATLAASVSAQDAYAEPAATAGLAQPQGAGDSWAISASRQIDAVLDAAYPSLEKVYRDIHAHPELAFAESRTAAILAARMRKLGLEVTEGVGKTGVVAILANGAGPTVLIRTDMDGLPMEEKTGLAYASKYTQVVGGQPQPTAHSCGHDIHMTWWLAAAEALSAMKDRWSGTVLFIAQPAEETTGGARAMLSDHLFERFPKPQFGFAAHVTPAPEGMVIVKAGANTSTSDTVRITFNGKGAHGSSPNQGIDPIVMGSHFVSDVQTVISREKEPGTFGVITVGSFQAGTVPNIIPDKATLQLTLRSQSETVRSQLVNGVGRTARAVSDMAGAPAPTIEHTPGGKMVINDATLVKRLAPSLKSAFGVGLFEMPASSPAFPASEDYSEFIEAGVASIYYWIGGYDPLVIADLKGKGQSVPVNHSPFFAPRPEIAIRNGAKALVLSVLTVASKP